MVFTIAFNNYIRDPKIILYSGCYHHPGCCIPDNRIKEAAKKKDVWERKSSYFKSIGILHTMRECEWKRMNIIEPSKTQMGRILCRDDEESLLKAIADDELFGFLVCDVSTPEHLIKEYETAGFLFPPVIQRMDMTEDHLSPYMRQRYIEEQRKPQTTVVQTYNGSGVFVLSSMVQLWMERGMKISNVKTFIQYQPGCALEPFVQKVRIYDVFYVGIIYF